MTATLNIPFTPLSNAKLDFYPPPVRSRRPSTLIVFAHGGGFDSGTKDIDPLTQPWAAFLAAGFAIASVGYTLVPTANYYSPVSQSKEIALAIQFMRHHRKRFRIDHTRVVFHGQSAGGIIGAANTYGPETVRTSTRPNACIMQSVLTDFRDADPQMPKVGPYFGQPTIATVPLADLENASAVWWVEQQLSTPVPTFGIYSPGGPTLPPVMDPHAGYWGIKLDAAIRAADPGTKSALWTAGIPAMYAQMGVLTRWVEGVLP